MTTVTTVTVVTVEDAAQRREAREAAYRAIHAAAGTGELTFSPFLVARQEPGRLTRRVLADDGQGHRWAAELVEAT